MAKPPSDPMTPVRARLNPWLMALALCLPASAALAGTPFEQLSPKQQELLEPLRGDWNSLNASQQERWIGVGRRYEDADPARQSMMRDRMGAWRNLSPQERASARENFKALKETGQGERNSSWNSYQSLDPDRRREFNDRSMERAPRGRRE